jgi:hypothetical protein
VGGNGHDCQYDDQRGIRHARCRASVAVMGAKTVLANPPTNESSVNAATLRDPNQASQVGHGLDRSLRDIKTDAVGARRMQFVPRASFRGYRRQHWGAPVRAPKGRQP